MCIGNDKFGQCIIAATSFPSAKVVKQDPAAGIRSNRRLRPFVAAQGLRRRLAETAAIVLGKVAEKGEAAIEGDRGGGLAGQRVAQPTMGPVEATLAQELERRDGEMSTEPCLEMADADAELARDIGNADGLRDPAAQDLAGALN